MTSGNLMESTEGNIMTESRIISADEQRRIRLVIRKLTELKAKYDNEKPLSFTEGLINSRADMKSIFLKDYQRFFNENREFINISNMLGLEPSPIINNVWLYTEAANYVWVRHPWRESVSKKHPIDHCGSDRFKDHLYPLVKEMLGLDHNSYEDTGMLYTEDYDLIKVASAHYPDKTSLITFEMEDVVDAGLMNTFVSNLTDFCDSSRSVERSKYQSVRDRTFRHGSLNKLFGKGHPEDYCCVYFSRLGFTEESKEIANEIGIRLIDSPELAAYIKSVRPYVGYDSKKTESEAKIPVHHEYE